MPFELEYDAPANLLYIAFTGNGTVEEVLRAVGVLEDALRQHDGADILVDSVGHTSTPAPADVRRVADQMFRIAPLLNGRLMLVVLPGLQYGLARMFGSMSEFHGVHTDVFTSVEEALATRDHRGS